MTHLFDNPTSFAVEMIEGLAAASGRWGRLVPGGVRSTKSETSTVAVVIGGGSGHYPAFGGFVSLGLAQGAALEDLFASPSAQQVYDVARAASIGRGVLLTYGNYSGDFLNFVQGQQRLRAEGIACRTVVVTNDISSAPPTETGGGKGIAGDVAVFKAASAAAEALYSLDDVTRVAASADAGDRAGTCRSSGWSCTARKPPRRSSASRTRREL